MIMFFGRYKLLLLPAGLGYVRLYPRSFSSSSSRPLRTTCTMYGLPKKNDVGMIAICQNKTYHFELLSTYLMTSWSQICQIKLVDQQKINSSAKFPFSKLPVISVTFIDTKVLQCTKHDSTSGSRHYLYRDEEGRVMYDFPSVTTILSGTRPVSVKFRLKNWNKRQIEKHGMKGFNDNKLRILNEGKAFHAEIADFFAKSSSFPSSNNSEYFNSIHELLMNDITDVQLCEENVFHEELGYAGTVDCLAKYKGNTCVIDWKTAQSPKSDLYDYPLQAVAYAGAINNMGQYKVDNVLIVVVCSGSPPLVEHFNEVKCTDLWEQWIDRLEDYQIKSY